MKVKLCGFTEIESVKTAIAQKCDFIGFVFCSQSPRHVTIEKAAKIAEQIPANIAKVAVVVDENFEFLEELAQKFSPDFFQFHGLENSEFLKKSRQKFPTIKIIKAFKIEKESDLLEVRSFEDCADIFLFDGKVAGSGQKFDWKIMQNFSSKKEWFLSGGLNFENLEEALKITGANMVDISSGVEKTRGQKSSQLIEELMKKTKNINSSPRKK
jgi:phosphoribosylanthranilate isomerase